MGLTRDEIEARLSEIQSRLQEIDREYRDHGIESLSEDHKEEWVRLETEHEEMSKVLQEADARAKRIKDFSGESDKREAPFQAPRARVAGDAIYDLSTIRTTATSPEGVARELQDRAKQAIERANFPHERAKREDVQGAVERLVTTCDDEQGTIAQRILQTGSPTYRRAFGKKLAGQALTAEEERALSTTTTAGGFAVPFALDPTIIPTSNLSVNPYRGIANVKSITVTKWEGVTSAGVTASFSAEATEASDNSPTLAQPTVTPAKAQAFIPFSVEIGEDWNGLQTEMARLLQDAKDDLEADRFTFGTAATPEPDGLLVGGTSLVNTAGTAAFVIGDLYKLEEALGPRFRPRASVIGNRFTYNKVRQFDTAGGAGLWVRVGEGLQSQVPTPGSVGNSLLGYPAYECSPYAAALTSGSKILTIGDFSYFVIVDRIGMNVEIIPHLFGGSNRYPTGQRGIYCYWRTGSKVTSANAFRTLAVL